MHRHKLRREEGPDVALAEFSFLTWFTNSRPHSAFKSQESRINLPTPALEIHRFCSVVLLCSRALCFPLQFTFVHFLSFSSSTLSIKDPVYCGARMSLARTQIHKWHPPIAYSLFTITILQFFLLYLTDLSNQIYAMRAWAFAAKTAALLAPPGGAVASPSSSPSPSPSPSAPPLRTSFCT